MATACPAIDWSSSRWRSSGPSWSPCSSLAVSVWLSLIAFAGTLVAAVALEREVRLLAREKVGVLPISAWLGGGRDAARREQEDVDETLTTSSARW